MKAAELNHHMLVLKLPQSALARLLPAHVTNVNRWCRGHAPVPLMVERMVKLWVLDAGLFTRWRAHVALLQE